MIKKQKWLKLLILLFVVCGGFFLGIGLGTVVTNVKIRESYTKSNVTWRRELAAGVEEPQVRDRRNQQLAENMKYVSMERTLFFSKEGADAGISVDAKCDFGCIVTILRDATGETIYKSGLIEPGHYLEKIHLDTSLKKGYYPCTAVWSYYTDHDEYVGETAWKVVVVVNE